MTDVIDLLHKGMPKRFPPTKRTVQTLGGSTIVFANGSAYRHLTGTRSKGSLEEKFFARVTKTDTCWLWKGGLSKDGYGRIYVGRVDGRPKIMFAHRWSYEHFIGPIPEGLVIDHVEEKCKHRSCVNPEHLEPTTGGDNVSRGWAAKRDLSTHCLNGHEYAVTGRTKKHQCRQCAREATKKWRIENLEEARKAHREAERARRAENKDQINSRRREARRNAQSSS